MEGRTVAVGDHKIALLDAVELIGKEHTGMVVITGSHGGIGSARLALRHPPALVAFNDAGVGKDNAGIAGLELLAGLGVPAVTVSAASARIGDASDSFEHGVISHVNAPAEALGISPGTPLKNVVTMLPLT